MKGTYQIIVQNKKIKYEFEICRNITVIRGDSATGKTALVDMIREYYENGLDSGIKLQCEKACVVLEGRNWTVQLQAISDSLVFIDEGNTFVTSREFASAIRNTDNYYIIVSRESLAMLPYSVTEIYGIRNSGKFGSLKQTCHELYHIYGDVYPDQVIHPDVVVTEDSNAGFQFFELICSKNKIECVSAYGKSNIFKMLTQQRGKIILVIADGAAFGSEMEKLMKLCKTNKSIRLFLPESFEWMILKSGVLKEPGLNEIIKDPAMYIESSIYFSWERFFTDLLVQKTGLSYLKYSKSTLNQAYMQPFVMELVLKVMDKIALSK